MFAAALLDFLDRHRRWVFLGLVFLYLVGYGVHWLVTPDSALHLLAGRDLAAGRAMADTRLNPGFPWLLSLLIGANPGDSKQVFLEANFLLMFGAWAVLGLTYWLFLLHDDRRTAILMTLLVGLTWNLYYHCRVILPDVPFAVGAMLFLVGFERARRATSCPSPRCSDPRMRGEGGSALLNRVRGSSDSPTARGVDPKNPSPGRQSRPPSPGRQSSTGRGAEGPVARVRDFALTWLLLVAGVALMAALRMVAFTFMGVAVLAVLWAGWRSAERKRYLTWAVVVVILLALAVIADPRRYHGSFLLPKEREVQVRLVQNFWPNLVDSVHARLIPMAAKETTKAVLGVNLGPWASIPFALALLAAAVALIRRNVFWGLLVIVCYVQWLLFYFEHRYFLPLLPVWIYGMWRGLVWVSAPSPFGRGWLSQSDSRVRVPGDGCGESGGADKPGQTRCSSSQAPSPGPAAPVYPLPKGEGVKATLGSVVLALGLLIFLACNLARIGAVISMQRAADPLAIHDGGRYDQLDLASDVLRDEAKLVTASLAHSPGAEYLIVTSDERLVAPLEAMLDRPVGTLADLFAAGPGVVAASVLQGPDPNSLATNFVAPEGWRGGDMVPAGHGLKGKTRFVVLLSRAVAPPRTATTPFRPAPETRPGTVPD